MAFIDNLDQKLSKFGRDALGKAKGATESVKISAAIREEQSKQKDIFQQMGAYYYRTYADQAEGDMKTWCDKIVASQQQISQYQEQLKVLKGVIYCPNCNAEVPLTAAFCNNCGTKIMPQLEVPVNAPEVKVCPGCGSPVSEGQMFCTNCGSQISATTD